MFIPSVFYTFTCLLKIPNAITNSFATVEMFRDVSHKRYKGKSISQQQQIYRKKVYQRLAICRQYPFFK